MTTFTAIILDAYECQIDSIGPFHTQKQAEDAAWEKWDGVETRFIVILEKNA
jgi:hypothetical protein